MTTTASATPTFRVSSRGASARLAFVAVLCAALTAGFVREVQHGSAQASAAAADEVASVATATHAG
jgi:hypothetical protein